MAKQKSAARTVGTPALVALADAGVEHAARAYEHDPRRKLGYGLEAAAALGVEAIAELAARIVFVGSRGVLHTGVGQGHQGGRPDGPRGALLLGHEATPVSYTHL